MFRRYHLILICWTIYLSAQSNLLGQEITVSQASQLANRSERLDYGTIALFGEGQTLILLPYIASVLKGLTYKDSDTKLFEEHEVLGLNYLEDVKNRMKIESGWMHYFVGKGIDAGSLNDSIDSALAATLQRANLRLYIKIHSASHIVEYQFFLYERSQKQTQETLLTNAKNEKRIVHKFDPERNFKYSHCFIDLSKDNYEKPLRDAIKSLFSDEVNYAPDFQILVNGVKPCQGNSSTDSVAQESGFEFIQVAIGDTLEIIAKVDDPDNDIEELEVEWNSWFKREDVALLKIDNSEKNLTVTFDRPGNYMASATAFDGIAHSEKKLILFEVTDRRNDFIFIRSTDSVARAHFIAGLESYYAKSKVNRSELYLNNVKKNESLWIKTSYSPMDLRSKIVHRQRSASQTERTRGLLIPGNRGTTKGWAQHSFQFVLDKPRSSYARILRTRAVDPRSGLWEISVYRKDSCSCAESQHLNYSVKVFNYSPFKIGIEYTNYITLPPRVISFKYVSELGLNTQRTQIFPSIVAEVIIRWFGFGLEVDPSNFDGSFGAAFTPNDFVSASGNINSKIYPIRLHAALGIPLLPDDRLYVQVLGIGSLVRHGVRDIPWNRIVTRTHPLFHIGAAANFVLPLSRMGAYEVRLKAAYGPRLHQANVSGYLSSIGVFYRFPF